MRVLLVTGGSSGIGRAVCEKFTKEGFKVYELSRRESTDATVAVHISCDVSDEGAVKAAMRQVYEKEGRIDVLVNSAGYGISGSVEFTPLDSDKRQFDVNFFGTVACAKNVITYMRETGGRIVNISSMAAPIAIPFQAMYSATKAAINSFTLALDNEVRRFGIRVCAVMPGDINTGFTAAREKMVEGGGFYDEALKSSVERMERDERDGMPPQRIAEVVYNMAVSKYPKVLSTVGGEYKLFWVLSRVLPVGLVNRLVGKIYS